MSTNYLVLDNVYFDTAQTLRLGKNDSTGANLSFEIDGLSLVVDANIKTNKLFGKGGADFVNFTPVTVLPPDPALFAEANLVYTTSNSAYVRSNTNFGVINLAFGTANAAYPQANLVFGVRNSAYGRANANVSNIYNTFNKSVAAYNQSNLSIGLFTAVNALFLSVNTLYDYTNTAWDTANTEELGMIVFDTQNAYADFTNTSLYIDANSAYNDANNENTNIYAFASINVTNTVSSNAYRTVNIAQSNINYVNTMTQVAFGRINANTVAINTLWGEANLNFKMDTLLSNVALTGGQYIINSSVITKPYIKLEMWIYGLGQSTNQTRTLTFTYSGNNGTTTTSPLIISFAQAETHDHYMTIQNADSLLANDPRELLDFYTSSAFAVLGDWSYNERKIAYTTTSYLNYMLFTWSGGATTFLPGCTMTLIGYYV